ncbi:unnamed protein product [Sphenostylis stenocarpa]|uniref:Pentatricopeptide repeat-containing protein n=1 Tax=Sphenostylis stenocarpa TaxID=92480 RepID=A0AA86SGF8_9FABA|nr:unnamed protein product [Sphenostylis stenocarpa]
MTFAFSVFGKIFKMGLIPSIMDNLCKDTLVAEANDLYSDMIYKADMVVKGEAIDLFNQMVLKNISADVYTFNILVDAFCKEGKVKQAKDVLDGESCFGHDVGNERQWLQPNGVTYEAIIYMQGLLMNAGSSIEG